MELFRYRREDGVEPFTEWVNALRDKAAQARVRVRLLRLATGSFGDCEPVGEGVSELRIHVGAGYRVYFGRRGESLVILLCGGDKRTQTRDIATAKKYWESYKRRTS